MQVREKVEKSRVAVFFKCFEAPEGRKVGSLKRRVRSHLGRWEMKNCMPLWREANFEVKICTKHTILGALLEVEMFKTWTFCIQFQPSMHFAYLYSCFASTFKLYWLHTSLRPVTSKLWLPDGQYAPFFFLPSILTWGWEAENLTDGRRASVAWVKNYWRKLRWGGRCGMVGAWDGGYGGYGNRTHCTLPPTHPVPLHRIHRASPTIPTVPLHRIHRTPAIVLRTQLADRTPTAHAFKKHMLSYVLNLDR